jgi:hypothetical protein
VNPLVPRFRDAAHVVAHTHSFKIGTLIHQFGLDDFLENALQDGDDLPTVACKALRFFCEAYNPTSAGFRFGVLTVCRFLHAGRPGEVAIQAMRDLNALLRDAAPEDQVRRWIASHF